MVLLELSEKSICEIAYEVGFCDQNNFTKQFKIHTGTTPKKYREQHFPNKKD
jgi:AraC-like DNA-binding protein